MPETFLILQKMGKENVETKIRDELFCNLSREKAREFINK